MHIEIFRSNLLYYAQSYYIIIDAYSSFLYIAPVWLHFVHIIITSHYFVYVYFAVTCCNFVPVLYILYTLYIKFFNKIFRIKWMFSITCSSVWSSLHYRHWLVKTNSITTWILKSKWHPDLIWLLINSLYRLLKLVTKSYWWKPLNY